MKAAAFWRSQLENWAIPQELLDQADESPYGWPVELFKRWRATETSTAASPTTTLLRNLLPDDGTLLDVGAGTGRASLPLAEEGYRVTAVEPDERMRAALQTEAAGLDVGVVAAAWPGGADLVPTHDVALAANVVYDVADIAPFLLKLSERGRLAVVLELTEKHPWSMYADYYLRLHGLSRPDGPGVDDLVTVIEELGFRPNVERWEREGQVWFESWEEIEDLMGRRLVVPGNRRHELRALLESDVVEKNGRFHLGGDRRKLAAIWWTPGQTA